jgi:glycosyltransferase involved in cell wall biosynthesis
MPVPDRGQMLFFDLQVAGHHPEYFCHLIRYRDKHPDMLPLLFAVAPDCVPQVDHLLAQTGRTYSGYEFVHPTSAEMAAVTAAKSVLSQASVEFDIASRMAVERHVRRCYLLAIDKYQYVLGRPRARRAPFLIRGILFSPLQPVPARNRSAAVRWRKHLQMLWMLRNPRIDRVFVFNNAVAAGYLNRRYGKEGLFVSVPDPLPYLVPAARSPGSGSTQTAPARTRFLVFGYLSRRKGIYSVLEALQLLPRGVRDRVAVTFAGVLDATDRESFLAAVERARAAQPSVSVDVTDRYLSYGEVASHLAEADCVLVPYVGVPEASSGVLGHAAAFRKPVIGPEGGLVGDLIREYGLGLTYEPEASGGLARAMERMCCRDSGCMDPARMERYAAACEPDEFVRLLVT